MATNILNLLVKHQPRHALLQGVNNSKQPIERLQGANNPWKGSATIYYTVEHEKLNAKELIRPVFKERRN